MKQTKFTDEAHVCNDMKGRMVSEYKRAVDAYKADVSAGKVKAPEFPQPKENAPREKPLITSTHNERKETEQARLI